MNKKQVYTAKSSIAGLNITPTNKFSSSVTTTKSSKRPLFSLIPDKMNKNASNDDKLSMKEQYLS
jgi:hypothetical protein